MAVIMEEVGDTMEVVGITEGVDTMVEVTIVLLIMEDTMGVVDSITVDIMVDITTTMLSSDRLLSIHIIIHIIIMDRIMEDISPS